MCGCGDFDLLASIPPDESFIATLEPGERIIVAKGHGFPQVSKDTEFVVANVAGRSALLTDGTQIACGDDDHISLVLGKKVPVVLSPLALNKMKAAGFPV
jgi:hypothetical protein